MDEEQSRTMHKKKFEEWLNSKSNSRNSTIMSKDVYDQTVCSTLILKVPIPVDFNNTLK